MPCTSAPPPPELDHGPQDEEEPLMKLAQTAAFLIFAAGCIGAAIAAVPPAPDADGAQLFAANCAACHQAHGEGVKGAFPALAGDAFVVGDPAAVVRTLLNGRGGMPSFRNDLTDAELAAVSSYVRASWGNAAPPIAPAAFTAQRDGQASTTERPIPAH